MYVLEAVTDTFSNIKEVALDGLCNIKDAFLEFMDEDAGITRKTLALIVLIVALFALIYGIIIAPKKRVIVETCSDLEDWNEDDWD